MSQIKYRYGVIGGNSSLPTTINLNPVNPQKISIHLQQKNNENNQRIGTQNSFRQVLDPQIFKLKVSDSGADREDLRECRNNRINRAKSYTNKSIDNVKRVNLYSREQVFRKNSSPNKVTKIYQILQDKKESIWMSPKRPKSRIVSNQKDKKLIQKLIDIRCKIVRTPKKNQGNEQNNQKNIIHSPRKQIKNNQSNESLSCIKLEKPKNICQIIMTNLQLSENEDNHEFRQLLMRKQEHQKKMYSNADLYSEVRREYKLDPNRINTQQTELERQMMKHERYRSDNQVSPGKLFGKPYQNDAVILKSREDIFSQFTFKLRRSSISRQKPRKQEQAVQGWSVTPY